MFQYLTTRWDEFSLRTRLYAIITLLGLLPIAGVVIAKDANDSTMRDVVALDRAARGSLYLERVNGLVDAVVMESRSIYMSADWTTAETFAQNLFAKLVDLRKVVQTWKAESIASRYSNIEELAMHIDNFIGFRTELVRLGREQATAAVRAFGDNDANQVNINALNEALSALANVLSRKFADKVARASGGWSQR